MTLKNLIHRLDELERKVEDKSYTPADVAWLIEELGEQAQTNQDLCEVVASSYQTGYKDAQAGENWMVDPVDVGRVTFGRYQIQSSRTLPVVTGDESLRWNRVIAAIGLAGEVGEVVDLIKKIEGHKHPINHDKLIEELGDVLWYVAALASFYQINLDMAAVKNIEKLRKRYPEGFSSEASINRAV